LSDRMNLPFVSKDSIKEILFNTLGHGDREWTEKLNDPTYKLLTYFIEQHLVVGRSMFIESPYDDDFPSAALKKLQSQYEYICVQIMCFAQPETLIKRFESRIGAPDRHPGHNDEAAFEHFKTTIKKTGKVRPQSLEGKVIELDTTDLGLVSIESLLAQIDECVKNAKASSQALAS